MNDSQDAERHVNSQSEGTCHIHATLQDRLCQADDAQHPSIEVSSLVFSRFVSTHVKLVIANRLQHVVEKYRKWVFPDRLWRHNFVADEKHDRAHYPYEYDTGVGSKCFNPF